MTSCKSKASIFCVLTFLGFALTAGFSRTQPAASVHVILWFDTEDYILPQSDDAAKRLAEILTRLGVRATFKIVGEKARALERRGRTDVIQALRKHEIGYHSDWHSRQPTVSVYLQNAGWEDGVGEFLRREAAGERDVRRIFGVEPVCYGQPGSAWAPQAYPALRKLGIHMYLDEAGHVGLDEQPFYFDGLLNVFNLGAFVTRMELNQPENLQRAREQFQRVSDKLKASGGGTISIYYHPCEFVHREFWDGVNFSRGKNPPPSEWRLPATKSQAEVEKGFADFEKYISFIKSQDGVGFVTASELMQLYADAAGGHRFTLAEIQELAAGVRSAVSFQRMGGFTVSASEIFDLVNGAVMDYVTTGALPSYATIHPLDGPARTYVRSRGGAPPAAIPVSAFAGTVRDVAGYCRERARVPDEIWIGAQSIPPETYLATAASFLDELSRNGKPPAEVRILSSPFSAGRYVADDSPKLWGWVIFPEGFHSPAIMELARLQAWTLKPAVLHR